MSEDVSLPEVIASVRAIAEHYHISNKAISVFFDLALKDEPSSYLDDLFATETPEGIKQISQKRLAENNRLASLALLASMEAVFRVDYAHRTQKKDDGSSLTKAFRDLNKKLEIKKEKRKWEIKPHFGSDILELWKKERPETKDAISYLKEIFEYRHWLAHGRYSFFKEEWKKYDFQEIYILAQALLEFF